MVIACSPSGSEPAGSATPSAIAQASPGSVASEDEVNCRPIDMSLPSGEPLDLTGSWEGNDLGPYQLRQFGDCLWWVGQNNILSVLFFGHLRTDFTVRGRWATIAASDHYVGGTRNAADLYVGSGVLVLDVVVGEDGTNANVSLTRTAIIDSPEFGPGYGYGVTTWMRVDDTPDHPIPGT
jgi:hypothetical protein